jgi:hypothetical protein
MNGSKYLARAITPVWTEAKMTAAENLIKEKRYWANHINYFHNSWKSTFLDMKPISTTGNKLAKVWFLTSKDTLKTNFLYADTAVFKGTNISIEGEGYAFSFLGITIPVFLGATQENVILLQLKDGKNESQSYIIPLVKALQESKKYSNSKKVSEWNWEKSNGVFTLNSTVGLTDITDGNKFELIKVNLNDSYLEGAEIPVIHPWHPRTFCNVYASDLARDILFPNTFTVGSNYAPWGTHQAAAYLHDDIRNNKNGHFKAVTFDEAWKYTNAGYVVYLTAYNRRYYANETKNPYQHSGHIATCYETKGYEKYEGAKVIQAGGAGTAGIIGFVTNVWTKKNYPEISNIKANLYLGYILK